MTFASFKKALGRHAFGAPSNTKKGRHQRGVALVLVITSVAVLTALSVDFQYNTNVDLQLAANARDELRAEYMARSAINISRLLLRFQKQFDGQANNFGAAFAALGLSGGAGGSLNIRLWDIVPVDCGLFSMILGAGGGSGGKDDKGSAPKFGEVPVEDGFSALMHKKGSGSVPAQVENFGDFEGCFHADLSDEEQKINVNRLNLGSITGQAPMKQAMILLADPRFQFIFDKADANGVKLSAQETLIALHDWIDDRDSQATLNVTGTGDPFPDGFGDENRNYVRYPHRYRSKNAPFDSLDELYQVDGVSDTFMAAFRDRLTVYPDKNKLLNINTNDPIQKWVDIMAVAANENDPKLRDPLIIQSIMNEIAYSKMFMPFMGMSTAQFVNIVEKNGIMLKPEIKSGLNNQHSITDKSETFTIKATGEAGKVQKVVTAVVRYNDGLGKVLYYREE